MAAEFKKPEAAGCDPSIRELIAKIDGLRELIQERDRRYDERFRAGENSVAAALAAQEKFNSAFSASSKEAILKVEASQIGVNERYNEFRGQLSEQAATLMPRKESEGSVSLLRELMDREIKSLRTDVMSLRESRSELGGEKGGRLSAINLISMLLGAFGTLVGIGGVVAAIAVTFRKAIP